MKFKKLFCFLLAVCMAALLFGCGEDAPVTEGAGMPEVTPMPTAVTIGDHQLTAVEFNYYYRSAVDEFYSAWANDSMYFEETTGFDPSVPLNEQYYDAETETTWADHFVQEALASAKYDYVMCDLAKTAGFTLSAAQKAEIENQRKYLTQNAQLYGYADGDSFLSAYYGPEHTVENYMAYVERQITAEVYADFHRESITYSQDVLRAQDAGDYDAYSSYSYDSIYLSYTYFNDMEKEDGSRTTPEEARVLMTAAAEQLATATTPEELEAKIGDLQVKESITLQITHTRDILRTALSSANKVLTDWVTDPQRKTYDANCLPMTTVDTDGKTVINGYYVAIFIQKNDNTQKMGNVRHLLVTFEGGTTEESTGNTIYTDAEKAAARTKAQEYLDMWKNGAANEEYFVELVMQYSQDSYLANGGLYENIRKDSGYVENFQNWATDPARKTGETGIIETEYGYHVMYFVGWSELTYRDYMITEKLRDADQDAWLQEVLAKVETEVLDYSGLEVDRVLDTSVTE